MRLTLFVSLIVVSVAFIAAGARAQSGETIHIVAVDADITGNTATSLGPLNACTRVEPGKSVTLDLVVDAVPASRGVIAYQINIEYDPAVLQVTQANNEMLLAATGSYEPFEGLSEPLPDTDGNYLIIIADLASGVVGDNTESGPGVITRLTFKAKASGLSTVAPVFNPPNEYPALIDTQNTTIGVDTIGAASVAVGQDCPVPIEATPVVTALPPIEEIRDLSTPVPTPVATTPAGQTPSPASGGTATATAGGSGSLEPTSTTAANNITDEGDGGASTGAVVAVAALALAGVTMAGGGAWLLLRRRAGEGGGDAAP